MFILIYLTLAFNCGQRQVGHRQLVSCVGKRGADGVPIYVHQPLNVSKYTYLPIYCGVYIITISSLQTYYNMTTKPYDIMIHTRVQ